MPDLIDRIKKQFFEKAQPLAPGFYEYHTPKDADFPYRLHLRVEENGEGVLILNASTIMHLNQTATEYAYHFIHQTPKSEILDKIVARYNTSYSEADIDFCAFAERIETLISTPDLDPVTYLDFDREKPFSHSSSAPFRLDCALTYRLREGTSADFTPQARVKKELTTEEWKTVIKKAWNAGIPHILFTGGEATLRDDLVELAKYSDELGQVTGLLTDGIALSDPQLLQDLLNAGLDHLLIMFDSAVEGAWERMKSILDEDIHTTVHVTITADNQKSKIDTINRLAEIGLENISLSTNDPILRPFTQSLRDKCAEMGLNLVWNLPVPYSQFNPIALETQNDAENTQNGGQGWLYVEPDGDVLPGQGINQVLGNILENDWTGIWKKVTLA